MRILFIVPSLDRGRDGVCDYVFSLGHECSRLGCDVCVTNLSGNYAQFSSVQPHDVDCYPRDKPEISALSSLVRDFKPDWVSLQYSPYGYSGHGVPWKLGRLIHLLNSAISIHLYFHETWIEAQKGWSLSSLKTGVISYLQYQAIRRLVKSLNPDKIHTSNPYYFDQLAPLLRTSDVAVLPVFSNIPVVNSLNPPQERAALLSRFPEAKEFNRVHVFFGKLPPEWPLEEVLALLSDAADERGLTALFLSVGEQRRGESLWTGCAESVRWKGRMTAMGGIPAGDVSRVLQAVDYGIAVSPSHLLAKSGAVAAMCEHGLPVFVPLTMEVNAVGGEGDYRSNAQLIFRRPGWESRLAQAHKAELCPQLGAVAEQFLSSLQK